MRKKEEVGGQEDGNGESKGGVEGEEGVGMKRRLWRRKK